MREVGDIYLVSLLKLRGHTPSRVVSDGRRSVWCFEDTPQLEADVGAHFDGTLLVSSRDFSETLRSVKGEAMNRVAVSTT